MEDWHSFFVSLCLDLSSVCKRRSLRYNDAKTVSSHLPRKHSSNEQPKNYSMKDSISINQLWVWLRVIRTLSPSLFNCFQKLLMPNSAIRFRRVKVPSYVRLFADREERQATSHDFLVLLHPLLDCRHNSRLDVDQDKSMRKTSSVIVFCCGSCISSTKNRRMNKLLHLRLRQFRSNSAMPNARKSLCHRKLSLSKSLIVRRVIISPLVWAIL